MNAFALEAELFAQNLDLNAMRKEWIKVSGEKGWLQNEEGWRRYLLRVKESGAGPKQPHVRTVVPVVLPEGFIEWWKEHPHSGWGMREEQEEFSVEPPVAYQCVRYHTEWKAHVAAGFRSGE